MSSILKEKLLERAGVVMEEESEAIEHQAKGNSRSEAGFMSHRNPTLTEEDILQHLQGKGQGQSNIRLRRRFIYRLAVALHSYGSSASRTEYLIERAAERLHVKVKIAIFPSLILLSFSDNEDEWRSDCHLITVESDLDVDKLGRADELANNVGNPDTQLVLAYWRLRAIAISHSEFGSWWWRLLSFAVSSATAALLFFEGSLWDACFSFMLGLIVGVLDKISKKSSLLANLIEFAAAVVVSFLARVASVHLTQLNFCFSNIAFSSLVQLLPGMSLTLGVSDMVAKAHVTGTSRIMYGLFSALQLGFGLSIGEGLVWWAQQNLPNPDTCEDSNLSFWWDILWFLGYTVSSSILLNARLNQWPGMALASGVGYVVSTLAGLKLGANASSVLAAFSVGIAGTSYSYFTGDLPLVMTLSGILLLVPGGIGVKGVRAMLHDDILSGMGFVFNMVVVGLSITIGLLMAKVILPAGLFGHGKRVANNKSTLAAKFEQEVGEPEEDMAI